MKTQILNFLKSDHFLFRQWDRSIEDELLHKILPHISYSESTKEVIIVLPSFLQSKGISRRKKQCLVLIKKNSLLITSYWSDRPNYLFDKEKKAHFQILYN